MDNDSKSKNFELCDQIRIDHLANSIQNPF